jgi:hypothetical protein
VELAADIICCTGTHYTWRKVTTTVHNIIVGKLWVDQHGDMDIVNHKDGVKCHLKYIPYSYFTRDVQRKVRQSQNYCFCQPVTVLLVQAKVSYSRPQMHEDSVNIISVLFLP